MITITALRQREARLKSYRVDVVHSVDKKKEIDTELKILRKRIADMKIKEQP